MNALVIIGVILWIYALSVFKRAKIDYFYYLLGSVGLFIIILVTIQPLIITPLTQLVASATGVVGRTTGLFESYNDYSCLFITTPGAGTSISLYIDYECSGVIEMMAFVSLLMFFKVYNVPQRLVLSVVGCVMIFVSNIIRIVIICLFVYFFGNGAYYIAHTIIGRIVFYLLSVILYYYIFTHSQIIKQRIGGFSYEQNSGTSVK